MSICLAPQANVYAEADESSTFALGRSTRTNGSIHPSHGLKSMHPWCHPSEPRVHRDQPTAERPVPLAQLGRPMVPSTRALGSTRSPHGAIHPSPRLNSIAPRCDPPEPSAQLDRPMVRSTRALGSTRSPHGAIRPSRRLMWPSHRVNSITARAIDMSHRAKCSIARLKSIDQGCDRLQPSADVDCTTISSAAAVASVDRRCEGSGFPGGSSRSNTLSIDREHPRCPDHSCPQPLRKRSELLDGRVNRFSPSMPS